MSTFRASIELGGKTATGIEVPDEVVEALGAGKRPPVTVRLGNHTYRSTVAARDGRYLVPLSAENREAAGVAAGDEVEVTIELDTEPRTVELPEDLAAALAGAPEARAFFDSLSNSQKRGYVDPIGQAKQPETRERRVAKAVEGLRAGKKRP